MAGTLTALNILVTASTAQAQAKLAAVDAQMKKMAATAGVTGGSMGKMGKGTMGAVGAVAAVGATAAIVGKQLYDLGVEFDDAYDKIRVGTGATGKELDKLKGSFREVAKTVPNDFGEVGQAVADLNTRMGLTGKPLERMAEDMLHLSNITGTDLRGNIKSVARAFTDWEVPVRKQSDALNGLFRLQQASGASVAEIADLLQKFGSPLRTIGMDVEYAAAMFANFERAGVNMQTMMPGMKQAIRNMTDPTAELGVKLKALGVSANDLPGGLQKIFAALGKDSDLTNIEKRTLAFEVFGSRAGADMAEAIRQGRFEVDKFMRIFNDKKGDTIRKAADEAYDFSENAKILGNNLKLFLEPAANKVFVAADDAVRTMVQLVGVISGDKKAQKKAPQWLKDTADVLKALWVVVKLAWEGMKALAVYMAGKFKAAVQVAVAVVKAISAAIRWLSQAWRDAWNWTKRAGNNIAGFVSGLWGKLKGGFNDVKDGITGVFRSAWDTVRSIFVGGADAVIGVVRKIIDVINLVPGVPDIEKPGYLGGGAKKKGIPSFFQRGGFLTGGAPSGDSIPAMLERGEYVLNRKAVQKVGTDKLDALNFRNAPRFQKGGRVGMIDGGDVSRAADTVTDFIPGVRQAKQALKGAGHYIGQLPEPNIPQPFTGVGPWVVKKAAEYIREKVESLFDKHSRAGGNVNLGAATGEIRDIMALAQQMGLQITSGFPLGTPGVHSPNSYHYQYGRAFDASNGVNTPEMMAFSKKAAGKWGSRLAELFYDPLGWYIKHGSKIGGSIGGHSDHVHVAMQRGGFIGRLLGLQRGGSPWKKTGYTVYNDSPPGSFGDLTNGYAELGTATVSGLTGYGYLAQLFGRSGELPENFPLDVKINGKVKTLLKRDRGWGQGSNSHAIDIWQDSWGYFGLNSNSSGPAWVRQADGAGSTGPSAKERRQAAAKKRKNQRQGIIDKLRKAVKDAETRKGKQSALWQLIGAYSRYGNLDKDQQKHILEKVRKAGGKLTSLANIPILQTLATWAKDNVDISGAADLDDSFAKRVAKARGRSERKAAKRRKIKVGRISKLGAGYPQKGALAGLAKWLEVHAELEDIADQRATAEYGPGGSDYTDNEVKRLIFLNESILGRQEAKVGKIREALGWLSAREKMLRENKRAATKSGQTWKLPGFRSALTSIDGSRKNLRENLRTLIGVSGLGGEIGTTRAKLLDLGWTAKHGTFEKQAQAGRDAEIADLLREQLAESRRALAISQAQMPIFQQFLPKYHTGGIVSGAGEVPIMAQAGEGVFTRDQMRAMGPQNVTVIIEDGAVDTNRIRVEVDGVLADKVRKVRSSRR